MCILNNNNMFNNMFNNIVRSLRTSPNGIKNNIKNTKTYDYIKMTTIICMPMISITSVIILYYNYQTNKLLQQKK